MEVVEVNVTYNSKIVKFLFLPNITGVTFGTKIFFRKEAKDVSIITLNHELIHVCQYLKAGGIFNFLFKYLIKEFFKPYRKKTAEIEAYARQEDFTYIQKAYPEYILKIK